MNGLLVLCLVFASILFGVYGAYEVGRMVERKAWEGEVQRLQQDVDRIGTMANVLRYHQCSDDSVLEVLYHFEPPVLVVCELAHYLTPEQSLDATCAAPWERLAPWRQHIIEDICNRR